uniref:Uncharacterized protein n=1 Tax=Anopheles atroparvus TaxID=41427 RepID=A0AAG5DWA0_ANOAO
MIYTRMIARLMLRRGGILTRRVSFVDFILWTLDKFRFEILHHLLGMLLQENA